jgi:hypothetical protein
MLPVQTGNLTGSVPEFMNGTRCWPLHRAPGYFAPAFLHFVAIRFQVPMNVFTLQAA